MIYIFASKNCFSCRNIFQDGFDALSKIDDAFLTKKISFGLSDNVEFLLACSINTYYVITNKQILISDVSIFNGNKKYPIGTSTFFLHGILRSSSFKFPLLLLTVSVENTIFTTNWQNLNKNGWFELHKLTKFLTKTCILC